MPTSNHMQNNNSKWILKTKTTKLLEGNMGDNICNFVVGRDFFIYIGNKRH